LHTVHRVTIELNGEIRDREYLAHTMHIVIIVVITMTVASGAALPFS
jgi:hypothetical protein